jgi:hypothetical protein
MRPSTPAERRHPALLVGAVHIAFDGYERLDLCDFKPFVAQSRTPSDHCVRLRTRRYRRLRNTRYPAARYHLTGTGLLTHQNMRWFSPTEAAHAVRVTRVTP